MSRAWKIIGLAGIVGVAGAATGVVVSRRRHREWDEVDPDDLRDRLHARLAEAEQPAGS